MQISCLQLKPRWRNRGLSYLEILIVVTFIFILTSVGLLSYRETRKAMRLEDATKDLSGIFGVARAMAISQELYFAVRIDVANGVFWIDQFEIDNSVSPSFLQLTKAKVVTPKALPDQVRFSEVRVTHVADPILLDGSSETINYPTEAYPYVVFAPSGVSDYAVIQLIREKEDTLKSENYYSLKLYSSTAIAKIFPRTQI